MFRSLSLIRNLCQEQTGGIDILYYPKGPDGVPKFAESSQGQNYDSNTGTVIVALASSQNMFVILIYQVCLFSDQKPHFMLVRNLRVPFPSVIQTFSLQYSPSGFPMLIAISRHGRMYRIDNVLLQRSDDDGDDDGILSLSFVECKTSSTATSLIGTSTSSSATCSASTGSGDSNPRFIGMDFISAIPTGRNQVNVDHHCSNSQSRDEYVTTKYLCMLVCGTSSLSPPLMIMVPGDGDHHLPMKYVEISGLENSHYAITAVKILGRNELIARTWSGIRHIWRSNAEDDSYAEEPLWDSHDISVAMIGLADGSIYAAFVFTENTHGNEKEKKSVSRAVKVYNPKHPKFPITSFCLVLEKGSSYPLTRFDLVCVDSRGYMIMIEKNVVDPAYRFQVFEPYQMLHASYIEAAFPFLGNHMHHSIIALASDGSTYLMGKDAITNKGMGMKQKKIHCPLKLPLRNDMRKMACCAISSILCDSPIFLMACLTNRNSFHLFHGAYIGQDFATTDFENERTNRCSEGSLLDSMFQRLAATGTNEMNRIPANHYSQGLATTRVMFDALSPLVEMCDPNDLKNIAEEITPEIGFPSGTSSSSSSIPQTQTVHFFQSVPSSASLTTPQQCCKVLGTRKSNLPARSKLLPVFHGGDALCNSAFANKYLVNPWSDQNSKRCNYMSFKSKCLTLDEQSYCSSQKRSGMTFLCPDITLGRFGVAIQIESRLALSSNVLEEISINHQPQDNDMISVLKLSENTLEISVSEKEREVIFDLEHTKQQTNKIEGQKYSYGSIAIPRMVLKDNLLYNGKLPGFDGNFILSVQSKTENKDDPFDIVDIVSSASETTSRAYMLLLQAYLKRILICRDTADVNNENTDDFLVHHILSDRELKRTVKILQQICSKVKNDRYPSSGLCLELHRKLRSSVQLQR